MSYENPTVTLKQHRSIVAKLFGERDDMEDERNAARKQVENAEKDIERIRRDYRPAAEEWGDLVIERDGLREKLAASEARAEESSAAIDRHGQAFKAILDTILELHGTAPESRAPIEGAALPAKASGLATGPADDGRESRDGSAIQGAAPSPFDVELARQLYRDTCALDPRPLSEACAVRLSRACDEIERLRRIKTPVAQMAPGPDPWELLRKASGHVPVTGSRVGELVVADALRTRIDAALKVHDEA